MAQIHAETEDMEDQRRPSFGLLWLLTAAMGVAAATFLAPMIGWSDIPHVPHVPWLVMAVAFAISESCALHLQFRGETHTVTLSEILLVLGLFVLSPVELVGAQALAVLVVFGLMQRLSPLKVLFNLAQFSFGTVVAIYLFRAIAGTANPTDVRTWVAAIAAASVASLIGILAIGSAITIAEGRVAMKDLIVTSAFGFAGTVVNTMLGLVTVIMVDRSPLSAMLMAAPIAVVFVAYRAYLSEHSKTQGLQFLYDASELLSGARDLEGGLLALLDFARDTFHAELAEVVLLSAPDETVGYRTHSGPGDSCSRLEPVNLAVVQAVLDAASADGDAVMLRPQPDSPLANRDGMEVATLLVATLHDETGVRGGVFVARQKGVTVETFDKDERRLFETFANHLGTTMEKQSLTTSLAQLRMLKQELAHQAYHDSLTGLANRLKFREIVDEALVDAARDGNRVAVLFIDLDDFKTVNDTMGHAAGDRLLEEVARRIATSVGEYGSAARLGGDEFAVLLPVVHNDSEVRTVADRILVALGDAVIVEGQPVVAHASIGIATHVGAADAAELMQHADVAMYTAKRNGKGRFDEFEPSMSLSVARRHQVKIGLERALQNNELLLEYQPIVTSLTGDIVASEALVRWKDPSRGMMPPAEFVGVAEETGLIVPIGRFVLQEACRQAAVWASMNPDLRVFVNLSTRQLARPDLVEDVCNALEDAGLNPCHLVLEVTETAMMRDIDEAKETLLALKRLGVEIAIDDFGTGFSSLSYLRQLPIDVLKIAKPIVDAICESPEDAAFVKGIIELGHVVGMKVVAEGVEHVQQYAHLVDMGCDYVQGYYHGPSMDPSALSALLEEVGAISPRAPQTASEDLAHTA
jgi:diguanylate cyclase (GGDEF)-like protein